MAAIEVKPASRRLRKARADWWRYRAWWPLCLGCRDAHKARGHVVIATLTAIAISAGPIWAAITGPDVVGLWRLFAGAFVAYGYHITLRLCGRDPAWKHDPCVQDGERGRRLSATITAVAGTPLPAPESEASCWYRDSTGHETKAPGRVHRYKSDGRRFLAAEPVDVAPGTYVVIWKERKLQGSGKWRPTAYCHVEVAARET